MKPGKSPQRLSELIKKAVDDHRANNSGYDRILSIVDEDGFTCLLERRLPAELHGIVEDGTVKRVPL